MHQCNTIINRKVRDPLTSYCISLMLIWRVTFFNGYLAAPRSALGYYRGGSLTSLLSITALLRFRLEGHWEFCNDNFQADAVIIRVIVNVFFNDNGVFSVDDLLSNADNMIMISNIESVCVDRFWSNIFKYCVHDEI